MIILNIFLAWLVWISGVPIINIALKKSGALKAKTITKLPNRIVISWGIICLAGFISLSTLNSCNDTAHKEYIAEIEQFRHEINIEFADTNSSPLTKEGLAHFNGLNFYPPNEKYRVEAKFILNPDPQAFEMETTTDRKPIYVKFGEAHFRLNDRDFILEVYQSDKAKDINEFKDHLFLPFKDHTNGNGSYGGGRFIDLKIPEGNTIIIDFNKAYNPYCAYNHKYSCPVPPRANHLDIEIPAGVKGYDH